MAGGVAGAAAAIGQQLLGSGVLEGSGNSNTNTKGQSNTNTNSKSGTTTKGISSTKGFTANQGVTATKGTVANKQTTGTSSTTVGTADQGAINTAKSITNAALKASTDNGAITSLINSTLNKASIAFAPTLSEGTAGSGIYNGSTVDLLSGFAKGQATADATEAVLQYKQGEQTIANTANQSVLDATKGSTTSGTDTTSGVQNTTGISNAESTQKNISTDKTGGTSNTTTAGSSDTSTSGKSSVDQTSQSQQNGLLDNSVICTELLRQGKLEQREWMISAVHFNLVVSDTGRTAYKIWSAPVVDWIKQYPEGMVAKIFTVLMKGRSGNIAWNMGRKGSQFSWTDLGCRIVVDTITHVTSWLVIPPKNWSVR